MLPFLRTPDLSTYRFQAFCMPWLPVPSNTPAALLIGVVPTPCTPFCCALKSKHRNKSIGNSDKKNLRLTVQNADPVGLRGEPAHAPDGPMGAPISQAS